MEIEPYSRISIPPPPFDYFRPAPPFDNNDMFEMWWEFNEFQRLLFEHTNALWWQLEVLNPFYNTGPGQGTSPDLQGLDTLIMISRINLALAGFAIAIMLILLVAVTFARR